MRDYNFSFSEYLSVVGSGDVFIDLFCGLDGAKVDFFPQKQGIFELSLIKRYFSHPLAFYLTIVLNAPLLVTNAAVHVLNHALGRIGTVFQLPIISVAVVISGVGTFEFRKTADCQSRTGVERIRHPNYVWFA